MVLPMKTSRTFATATPTMQVTPLGSGPKNVSKPGALTFHVGTRVYDVGCRYIYGIVRKVMKTRLVVDWPQGALTYDVPHVRHFLRPVKGK